jgi:hypothetical protein
MNHDLFCSIYVDRAMPRDVMASLVAELTGGVVARRGVDCSWARITFDDDYGDFELLQADPNDFLGWPTLLEVMPPEAAERVDVVRGVISLMNGLISRGMRVLGQAEYAEELPGAGEVAPARTVT